MGPLEENFTLSDLNQSVGTIRHETQPPSHENGSHARKCVGGWPSPNYELRFSEKLAMSERINFPVSPNETNGIEDARFCPFYRRGRLGHVLCEPTRLTMGNAILRSP